MKFLIRIFNILFIISIFSLYFSCGECTDCDIYDKDPFIKVNFMNGDSLLKSRNRISAISQRLEQLKTLDTEEADAEEVRLNAERERLNKTIQKINLKRFKIDSLKGEGTDKVVYYRDSLFNDSLVLFNFPLNMYRDTSTFYIYARNQKETLSVKYNRDTIFKNNILTIRAYNLEIIEHSYDSIPKIKHSGSAKNSNETTITLTF